MNDDPRPPLLVKVPPPAWMLALLVAAYLFDGNVARLFVVAAPALGMAVGAAGVALDIWAWLRFQIAGTEIMPASATNKKLIIVGPYRITRNPMYLGLVLLASGIALYVGTLPYFFVPILLFLLCDRVFVPFEEAKMRRQFGAPFTDYCAQVRRWV